MRTQIFFRVYGILFLLAILLLIRILLGFSTFKIFGSAVFLFSVTMVTLLTDKRYLQELNISGNQMSIRYINHFLQSKTIEYDLENVTEIKLSKRRSIAPLWLPDLQIKSDGEWKNFLILSKEQYSDIQNRVELANVRLNRQGARALS